MSTFERVATWNTLCGKTAPEFGTPAYFEALKNQAERIAEELEELQEAIAKSSAIANALNCEVVYDTTMVSFKQDGVEVTEAVPVNIEEYHKWLSEILDAGCDLDVVVAGANFLSGHAYSYAIDAVLSNNDAKYTHDLKFATESCNALGAGHEVKTVYFPIDPAVVEEYEEAGFKTMINNGVMSLIVHSVHRTMDDKICKMIDHPKVDLRPFTRTEA